MRKTKILVVDDEDDIRYIVREALDMEGFQVTEARDGRQAVELFGIDHPDIVLLDLVMPGMNGIETLKELKKKDGNVPVIMLTGHGDIATALDAIRAGAYEFTIKPPEFESLIISLKRAVERSVLEKEFETVNTALRTFLENQFGRSRAMKNVINQIIQVAPTDFSVIIQGETGTGKTMISEAIHNVSRRADRPFVRMDIGLIPDTLVESELFGYKKGAFTGAERDKAGYLETAHRGTIFIDELENMSPLVQSKLLSFMETKKIFHLGSTASLDADVRILAATNRDLGECVVKKEFREDLFYRLSEFVIKLPPLRERREDIPFLARKFMFDACTELKKPLCELNSDALRLLTDYSWPGNIRELKNMMRRACLVSEGGTVDCDCLDLFIQGRCSTSGPCGVVPLKEAVREFEKSRIEEAIELAGGNKAKAAEMLRISVRSLFDKIKEYGID